MNTKSKIKIDTKVVNQILNDLRYFNDDDDNVTDNGNGNKIQNDKSLYDDDDMKDNNNNHKKQQQIINQKHVIMDPIEKNKNTNGYNKNNKFDKSLQDMPTPKNGNLETNNDINDDKICDLNTGERPIESHYNQSNTISNAKILYMNHDIHHNELISHQINQGSQNNIEHETGNSIPGPSNYTDFINPAYSKYPTPVNNMNFQMQPSSISTERKNHNQFQHTERRTERGIRYSTKEYLPVSDILNEGTMYNTNNQEAKLGSVNSKSLIEQSVSDRGVNIKGYKEHEESLERNIKELKMDITRSKEKLRNYESDQVFGHTPQDRYSSSKSIYESLSRNELIDMILKLQSLNQALSIENENIKNNNEWLEKYMNQIIAERDYFKNLQGLDYHSEKILDNQDQDIINHHSTERIKKSWSKLEPRDNFLSSKENYSNIISNSSIPRPKKNKGNNNGGFDINNGTKKSLKFIQTDTPKSNKTNYSTEKTFDNASDEYRKIINELCKIFGMNDPSQLISCANKTEKVMKTVPCMEKFITDVYNLIFTDVEMAMSMNNLENVMNVLKRWKKNNTTIEELQNFRQKILKMLHITDNKHNLNDEILTKLELIIEHKKFNEYDMINQRNNNEMTTHRQMDIGNHRHNNDIGNYKNELNRYHSPTNDSKNCHMIIEQFKKLLKVNEPEKLYIKVHQLYRHMAMLDHFKNVVSVFLELDEELKIEEFLNDVTDIIQNLKFNQEIYPDIKLTIQLQKLLCVDDPNKILHKIQK